MSKFSFEGFQILWCKKTKVSRKDRQLIKKSLIEKSETIGRLLEFTKQESLNNREAEIRLRLAPDAHQKFYLAVESGMNAWHLLLETNTAGIGEIVHEGGKFMRLLNDKDVEVETL